MNATDTIFALSTGSLPSGVAVIRLSGPASRPVVEQVLGRLPTVRSLTYGKLFIDGGLLDYGMVVWFQGPHSATGEDCAEIHLHGSIAVVNAAQRWLSSRPGLRRAEPGEFTLRGFHNGRFDLTTVESLSDLVAAETEAQRLQAIGGVEGTIRDRCTEWRQVIQSLRAGVEAELDFSDQDDVQAGEQVDTHRRLQTARLADDMRSFRNRLGSAEIVRRGYKVAIVGAPNAGKSSLINALAMRDVAIVTAEPGTTRDLVETTLDLGGYKVIVTDTAGIRRGESEAETVGIELARRAAAEADLVLALSAPGIGDVDILTPADVVKVGAKNDLGGTDGVDLSVSTRTGDGLSSLIALLGERAAASARAGGTFAIRERHAELMDRAVLDLEAAAAQRELDLVAEHLRRAAVEIGRIVGLGDTEMLLGEIFSRFCIGK